MIKYLRDKAHCKHEGYTKGDFATVTATITNEEGVSNGYAKFVAYPDGFTKDNSIIISVLYNETIQGSSSNGLWRNGLQINGLEKLTVILGDPISVALSDSAPLNAKIWTIKITLMRID